MKELTTKEAVILIEEISGRPMSVSILARECKAGRIIYERKGRQYFFKEADVRAYKRRKRGPKKGSHRAKDK